MFGTTLNWRLSVVKALQSQAHAVLNSAAASLATSTRMRAAEVDWAAFAQQWRQAYAAFVKTYPAPTEADQPFKSVDQHHHESLVALLEQHGLSGLFDEQMVEQLAKSWHYLAPWPDSVAGLEGLAQLGFQTSTLSNGNMSLLTDMVAYAHLPFTHILSAEMFRAYKPSAAVYRGAAAKLGLEPGQCAMVAAHLEDLRAAHACGLQTIYVQRLDEDTLPAHQVDVAHAEAWVDVWIGLLDGVEGERGFLELVKRLSAL